MKKQPSEKKSPPIAGIGASAEKVFNLLAGDAGRPLSDIRHNLAFSGLEQFIAEAIGTISAQEREVQDTAGNWYVLRVRPYLTLDNKIDGAVLFNTSFQ
ncbi:MAG: PAS domain-containing protein [Verrucomicrobiota bacterium]|jgi:two-component system CheB/CheR fusion protein